MNEAGRGGGAARGVFELERWLDARRLRWLARGLVAYGVFGLVSLALIAFVAAQSLGVVEPLGDSLETQRQELVATLRQTSVSIHDAATATSNAGSSLGQARDSAHEAATLSRSVAVTMREVAAASQVSIFGAQPLGGLGAGFTRAAQQSEAMGKSLDSIGTALGTNGGDISTVQGDLNTLAAQVDSLGASLAAMPPVASTFSGAAALRWTFVALAIWLAIPAALALAAGALLWRWLDRTAPARPATAEDAAVDEA